MSLRVKQRVVGKAANYTINTAVDQPNTLFTNEGATGAITFTLPTPNAALFGSSFQFAAVEDQSITVQPPTADTGIGLNDQAIDSLAISTGGQKIGGVITATCVRRAGTTYQWLLRGEAVGITYTLAT